MKRVVVLFIVMCLVLPSVSWAQAIQQIQITYSTGVSATYNHETGNLNWADGDVSVVQTESDTFIFHDTVVNADWSRYDSGTNPTRARFNLVGGSWMVQLYQNEGEGDTDPNNWAVKITGKMYLGGVFDSKYCEARSGKGALEGKAWLNILTVETDPDWYGGEELDWDNDDVAGLYADITLDGGTDISDYLTDNYSAVSGSSLTIFADQGQVVPEPMTLVLLGLGGLALIRKRRA